MYLIHNLYSITPPYYDIYKYRDIIMTMIMIITSSNVVAMIAVHSYTMYSSDSCTWSNCNIYIYKYNINTDKNTSIFVNDRLIQHK